MGMHPEPGTATATGLTSDPAMGLDMDTGTGAERDTRLTKELSMSLLGCLVAGFLLGFLLAYQSLKKAGYIRTEMERRGLQGIARNGLGCCHACGRQRFGFHDVLVLDCQACGCAVVHHVPPAPLTDAETALFSRN